MYAGWTLVLTLIIALLCGQSHGFWWPFVTNAAAADAPEPEQAYPDSSARRIAIIGAGAAGASTAWHLQQLAQASNITVNITVFERHSYIGGRSTTVNAYGNASEPVELGASIFVDINTILKNATRNFGLKPKESETDTVGVLGIWNGKNFVYTQKDSGWKYWDIAKLLWKYGLAPIRTQRLTKNIVAKFMKLYEPPFFPFRSLSDRAYDLELTPVTSLTGEQFLAENNIVGPFTTDIIQASTRVNYGQNLNVIHGLETMVCMSIDGAMQIEGGNWRIFDGMVNGANATVLLNTTVFSVSKSKGKYRIKSSTTHKAPELHHINIGSEQVSGESTTRKEPYDTVVLAGPLQFSGIKFEEGLLKHTPDKISYVVTHVTLFASPKKLNPVFFNLTPDAEVPTTILTTLPPDEVPENPKDGVGAPGFFSISTLREAINPKTLKKEYLYKIFSPKKLTPEFLSGILNSTIPPDLSTLDLDHEAITWYHPHAWHSYPFEFPRVTFEDLELARGLYYTSGIESFISTMETSALMGKNVAQLIVDDYLRVLEDEKLADAGAQKVVLAEGGHVEEL